MLNNLQILLVDEAAARTEMLIESLLSESASIVARINCDDDLLAQVKVLTPDVMIIDMESPDELMFEKLCEISETCPIPVVFFAEHGETEIIKSAVKAGIGAFIVDGLTARKIAPVIELSIERFKERQLLQSELSDTKNRLEERKLIEKAKGILMQRKAISEEEAYQALRKLAMKQNKKVVDVAKSTIELSALFE